MLFYMYILFLHTRYKWQLNVFKTLDFTVVHDIYIVVWSYKKIYLNGSGINNLWDYMTCQLLHKHNDFIKK